MLRKMSTKLFLTPLIYDMSVNCRIKVGGRIIKNDNTKTMFILKGIIKEDKNENFTRKDGTPGVKRSLFIEPAGSIYPIKVGVPLEKNYGKVGASIEILVNVFPYYYIDKQRKRAFLSVYVPDENKN